MNSKPNRDGKLRPCLAYFFHMRGCEKLIYKVLTKNTGGGMMSLEKLTRNYNMGKQINKLI